MAQDLIQTVFEKKYDLRDFPRQTEIEVDPDATISLTTWPIEGRVLVIRGYKFEPDELGKIRVTIAIDGETMCYRMPLTEEFLEFQYDTPRIAAANEKIWIRNLDPNRKHKVMITRYYERLTKDPYARLYEKAEELIGLK